MLTRSPTAQTWILVGALALVVALAVAGWAQYWRLQASVDQACRGVVATLDLTEWVQVCRPVHPEDLDR
jgi:hypothetical protein